MIDRRSGGTGHIASAESLCGGFNQFMEENELATDWGVPHTLTRHPFSGVHDSSAIQQPTALGGSVYRKVESLWHGTQISDVVTL